MLFKTILMSVISIFFAAGALDYIIGGKLGLKTEFENAFSMIGKIMLNIVGMISLAPALAQLLKPLVVPVFSFFGIDAAMFAPTFLAPDAGGYSVAVAMASDAAIGAWAGTVVAAHIGAAFSFNIPVTLGVIDKSHYKLFSLGALSGLIACPFGCVLGGLISGLPLGVILINMIPSILLALVVILGLVFKPDACMKVFLVFVKILRVIIVIGLTAAGIERLTGIVIIPGMNPISSGFLIAGTIGLTLAGILVMTKILSVLLKKPLARLSRALKINELSLLMCINALCVVLPGAVVYDQMDKRGRIIFAALVVTAANSIGAHLSYIGLTAPEMLPAAITGKLFSGLLGVIIALMFFKRSEKAGEL